MPKRNDSAVVNVVAAIALEETLGEIVGTTGRRAAKSAKHRLRKYWRLSGLPNANAKSLRFSYAISQIAPLPPVVALNRNSKSQIAARYAASWHAISQIALVSFL